jgi:hypothetical protein
LTGKVPTQLKSGIQMSLSRKVSDIEKASMMAINVISDQHKNINHVFFFEKGHATKPQQRNTKHNFKFFFPRPTITIS